MGYDRETISDKESPQNVEKGYLRVMHPEST
jgi:hypothetical protein